MKSTVEGLRLATPEEAKEWRNWGPYLSDRQWATVREDYTADGNVWQSVVHDHARSKAYRWGEDGIGGFCNEDQRICFAWAFWNTKDPIIKERLFGLTSHEGNHGEDVKELYYYLDSTPSHSYMQMLYKYPHGRFPYEDLVDTNGTRSKLDPEYEILDTGIFEENRYFDIYLNYAKETSDSFLFEAEVFNRGEESADLHLIPTLWFRNTWSSGRDPIKPQVEAINKTTAKISHHLLGDYYLHIESDGDELVFCDNETNRKRLYKTPNHVKYTKDGINDYIIHDVPTVNPEKKGTKAAAICKRTVAGESSIKVKVRLTRSSEGEFDSFDSQMTDRRTDANEFYGDLQRNITSEDDCNIQRQAFAGMMWSKQFYYYNVKNWLQGDPGRLAPPKSRLENRNTDWRHLFNYHVISMPDKWEYPWYAAWDLAFHTIPIARIDADFAKQQLELLLQEQYLHPNGQIPAYEWDFGDVNPPVHAWAVLRVFEIDKEQRGDEGDLNFLQKCFHKLMLNFTWWVNRKDKNGNNIFEGGFLGLDNIGVFDRNHPVVDDAMLEQADSTSWMAMFALNMLKMSNEIALSNPVYQDMSVKFFQHFLHIAGAMNSIGVDHVDLWDDEDNFYYDVVHTKENQNLQLKVRSMVGLIPLFAVEILQSDVYHKLPEFKKGIDFFLQERPLLAAQVSRWTEMGQHDRHLLSIMRGFRVHKVLERMLDENEFLSEFGIRALSKHHLKNPYEFEIEDKKLSVGYLPGESDSSFFGGNSNWRGPIWFPVNYLLLESLIKFHEYYGDQYQVELPTGSGNQVSLKEVADHLSDRLIDIFRINKTGKRPVYGQNERFQSDPHFKDHILFYEYFNGDDANGLGASHQTGWTGLVAELIYRKYRTED